MSIDSLAELTADPGGRADTYAQLAYPGFAYAATHPARLQALARLFGRDPAPAESCRVLELGCGDGANSLSIAQSLPDAAVLGVDASQPAIARGTQLAKAAGLANVQLRCSSFERLPAELGQFDYIIAHGVYSWIPPEARGALLSCISNCLAEQGIAFVSYNAYPGSYLRDMARDILRYHVRESSDPQERLAHAYELMRTVVEIEEPSPFARVLREHMERMLRYSDALLFHDDLAEVSTPFYFHEFMAHAQRHGLQFLSEAELAESQMREVPASAARLMDSLPPDVLVREQYLDFFKNRMFRQTLLCHDTTAVDRALDDIHIESLFISSPARAEAQQTVTAQTFATPEGFTVTSSEPLVCAALGALARAWPAALGFGELLQAALADAQLPMSAEQAARLRAVLLEAYLARIVQLHGCPPPLAAQPPQRPLASPLARAQLAGGAPALSSLLHTNVRLQDELEPRLMALLDGTRDRQELLAELTGADAQSATAEQLERALARLAGLGLLQGA